MALNGRDVAIGTVGAIAGALIGAGVALLVAPESGDKTRAEIARVGKKARRRVEELTDDLSDKVGGVIRTMEGTAREINVLPAPTLGQNTDEVYTSLLGYTPADLARWRSQGVI